MAKRQYPQMVKGAYRRWYMKQSKKAAAGQDVELPGIDDWYDKYYKKRETVRPGMSNQ